MWYRVTYILGASTSMKCFAYVRDDVHSCRLLIVEISSTIRVGEASDFNQMTRSECQLHILGSPKVSEYVLHYFNVFLFRIRRVTTGGAYKICKVGVTHTPILD